MPTVWLAESSVKVFEALEVTYVYDREDIEVILVDEPLDLCICCVIRQQVVREVLGDHRSNPFARMNGTVNYNSRLTAFSRSAVEVDPCDRLPLKRIAYLHNLGVRRIRSLEVLQELQVVGVSMV